MDLDELFSLYAKSYDIVTNELSFYQHMMGNVQKFLANSHRVLDLGCGTGNLTIALAKKGKKVLAIDQNKAMIERTKEKVVEHKLTRLVDVCQYDLDIQSREQRKKLTELLGQNSFDGAASINVLYCLHHPFALMDLAYNALTKEGTFVVSGPKHRHNTPELMEAIRKEFEEKGLLGNLHFRDSLNIVNQVNAVLASNMRNFFSTRRMDETLVDFIGFDNILGDDSMQGLETYLGNAFFVCAQKHTDYPSLGLDEVKLRLATQGEIDKILKARYHIIKERLKIPADTTQGFKEVDEFDNGSLHLIAEHNGKILGYMRITPDNGKLPLDENDPNLRLMRKQGVSLWEPGRLIKMPYAPSGIGKLVFQAVYQYIKEASDEKGMVVGFYDEDNLLLFKKWGYEFDNEPIMMPGLGKNCYTCKFFVDNPPRVFLENQAQSLARFTRDIKDRTRCS